MEKEVTHPHAAAIDALNELDRYIDVVRTPAYIRIRETIRAALANAPQWLPIESAPMDGVRVLIFSNGAVLSAFFDTDYGGWRVGREYYFYYPSQREGSDETGDLLPLRIAIQRLNSQSLPCLF